MQKQKIVPLGKDMTYIDAFFATKALGGLPSNALHDDTLQSDTLLEQIKKSLGIGGGYNFYGAWAREMITYPEKNGVFAKGDIKDHTCNWVIPARYVPKKAIGRRGIALVFSPKDIIVANGKTTVIPQGKVVVQSFPQKDGLYDYDRRTRIPIDANPKGGGYWNARYLYRRNEQSLRPVSRWGYFGGDGRYVDCSGRPDDYGLGVGVVELAVSKRAKK